MRGLVPRSVFHALRSIGVGLFACLHVVSAAAFEVVYDDRTPQSEREWADKDYIREQLEVIAGKICRTMYKGSGDERRHENFTLKLFLEPDKGGVPGFAVGRRVTIRTKHYRKNGANSCIGCLSHEMTHSLDRSRYRGEVAEANAVWVTDYNVRYGFRKCSSPSIILDRRYEALRGSRKWGGYRAGAGFYDFLEQEYGTGTVLRLFKEYKTRTKNGPSPLKQVVGKERDALVEEWRRMETIYDPVYQWNYNGTAEGAVRNDKKYCGRFSIKAENAKDKSGAWLNGEYGKKVEKVSDGCLTIALHGRFPARKDKVAIASLGSAKAGENGKALLLTTGGRNALAAHVIAKVPGQGCKVVLTTHVPVPDVSATPHSVILTVKGGSEAGVVVDGRLAAKIDMKSKCGGCTFTPVFSVGGIWYGFGVQGFSEPDGEGSILLDDVRVFTRTFRDRETKQYAEAFGPDYRGGVAVEGTWCGPQGGTEIDNPKNWRCYNSYGEQIVAIPSKETAVTVWYRDIPSIPPNKDFACKSFTIDGLAVVDEAHIDLRGVRVVDVADNTRIITRGGHKIAVNALRGGRLRLDGKLAVTTAMKVSGKLELKGGSALRLPEDQAAASVEELALSGDGSVSIRPGVMPQKGKPCKVMRVGKFPEDLSRLSLHGMDDPSAVEFKPSTDKKSLVVYRRK